MRQPRQERALATEPFDGEAVEDGEVDELDGDVPLEASVAPPRQPDGPHAARAERPDQRVDADGLTGHRHRHVRLERHGLEEVGGHDALVLGEQPLERGGELRILGVDRGEELIAQRRLDVERAVEERAQSLPERSIQFLHGRASGLVPGTGHSLDRDSGDEPDTGRLAQRAYRKSRDGTGGIASAVSPTGGPPPIT